MHFAPVPVAQAAAHYQTTPKEVYVKRHPYDNWSPVCGDPTYYPGNVKFALVVKLGGAKQAPNEVLVNDD